MVKGKKASPAPDTAADDLNNTDVEAPGGTQATHSAAANGQDAEDESGYTGPRVAHERGGRGLSSMRDAGRDYMQNDVHEIRLDLEDRIREYPVASIALAVLSGYLLAKLVD